MGYDRYGNYRGTDPRTFDRFFPHPLLGIDESGVGAIAGPISVAGVVLPRSVAYLDALHKARLRDSKDITEYALERIYRMLLDNDQVEIHTAIAGPRQIEELGQSAVLRLLYDEVCTAFRLRNKGGSIILDGGSKPSLSYKYEAVVKGDQKSFTVAAASVVAKAVLNERMRNLEAEHPQFSFGTHKGYKTPKHVVELEKHGACPAHRRNTRTIRAFICAEDLEKQGSLQT